MNTGLPIKKDIDQWYSILTAEIDKKIEKVPVKTKMGIDVGLTSLLTLGNREHIEPPVPENVRKETLKGIDTVKLDKTTFK